jgi:hypothetical protein
VLLVPVVSGFEVAAPLCGAVLAPAPVVWLFTSDCGIVEVPDAPCVPVLFGVAAPVDGVVEVFEPATPVEPLAAPVWSCVPVAVEPGFCCP